MSTETESPPETPANTPAGEGLASPPCSALELYGEEAEAHRIRAELQMLERLRIGSRVAVKFSTRYDEHRGIVPCKPFTAIGAVVGLQLFNGRGHVDIHFDGEEVPVSSFSPLETMLVEQNSQDREPQ
jgi:hypothetical protein